MDGVMAKRREMVRETEEQRATHALEQALTRLVAVKDSRPSRENSLAITKLQEAIMWSARDGLVKDHGLGQYEPRLSTPVTPETIVGGGQDEAQGTVVEPRATHRGPISRPDLPGS